MVTTATSTITSLTKLPSSPAPLTTATLNKLRFLSPKTWYGLLQVNSRSPFTPLNSTDFGKAFLASLLPMMTLFVLIQLAEKRQSQIASISRLKNVLLASPWMLHNVLKVAFHFSLFLITVLYSLLNQK